MSDQPGSDAREAAVVDAFVHLSDTLVADYDVIDFLHYLTERCVDLAAVDEAGVMLVAPSGNLQAVAASSERSGLLELFEIQNHDGPCLDAFRTGAVVTSDELARDDERWPTFASRAVDVGFHAVHSIPLKLRNTVIGALNLLRTEPGGVDERDARLLRAMSDIATVGVLQERRVNESLADASGLQIALTSRIRIEQAKGVIAERSGISIDEAFAVLRDFARRNSLRLTDVAAGVAKRTLDLTTLTDPDRH